MTTSIPPDVLKALREGRQIDALKLLRKNSGVGLAEAKALVDAVLRSQAASQTKAGDTKLRISIPLHPARDRNLSPGEVPRTSSGPWTIALVLGAVIAALLLLR